MSVPLMVLLVCVALYHRTVFFNVSIDDARNRKENKGRSWKHIKEKFYGGGTFDNLKADHFFTLCLHAIASILVFYAFGQTKSAGMAALLYAVHPVNNQTAVWLNGRRYLLNVIFHLSYLSLPVLVWFSYPLALYFHPSGLLAPLALMHKYPFGVLAIPATIIFFWTNILMWFLRRRDEIPDCALTRIYPKKIIVAVKTIGFYFMNCVFPVHPRMYYKYLYRFGNYADGDKSAHEMDWTFFVGFAVMLSSVVTGNFYLILWVLVILQYSNILTVTQTLADRYCSLPNVFLMMWLATILSPTAFAVFFTYYAIMALQTSEQHRDPERFFNYHLWHDPGNVEASVNKARIYCNHNDLGGALECLKQADHYNPKDFKVLSLMAIVLSRAGEKEGAKEFARQALDNQFAWPEEKLTEVVKAIKEG